MYELSSKIEIGDKTFNRVHQVNIKKDVAQLINTATIKIPTTARLVRSGEFVTEIETAKTFAVGDEARIYLGYDGNLREEFRGFVAKIKPNIPLEIELEDETFILKRKNLNKSFRKTNLRELIEFILSGTGISLVEEIPDIQFDIFYLKNVSAAKALAKISKEYGLRIYFTSWKVLYVGLINEHNGEIVKYAMGQNVISNRLEFVTEDDVKLKVKAISILPNNEKIEVETGDADGEQRTLHFYNIPSKAELKIKADSEIVKYKYTGYKGSLTAFLIPICEYGNIANISDNDFPERSGNYLVNSLEIEFGENGARRKVEVGIKVNT